MSLIEQAAKRMAQLRKAGVEVDGSFADSEELPSQPQVSAATEAASTLKRQRAEMSATAAPTTATVSRRIELDLNALAASGLISPDAPRSQLADQYRVIKRPLIANAMGKGAAPVKRGNLIMVTSAISGEERVSRRSILR